MIVHEGYRNIHLIDPVVTLGIFDGVHRGHRALIDKLVSVARQEKGESVVITFYPHPRQVLGKDPVKLMFLSTLEEKKALLEKANVDHMIILEFNKEFSQIGACDFVKEILIKKIGTKHIIIGYNHQFGRKGEGNFDTIIKCTASLDFKVEQVARFQTEEGTISSSVIRKALLNGSLEEANILLGYSYALSGTVISGKRIGRAIGFPTANIKPADEYKLIPGDGVYAVEVLLDGMKFRGMLNIGSNPTVNNDPALRSIEVNILEFEKDIYGEKITVIFRKRLRDEMKFENTEQMAEQMKLDMQNTMRFLY